MENDELVTTMTPSHDAARHYDMGNNRGSVSWLRIDVKVL